MLKEENEEKKQNKIKTEMLVYLILFGFIILFVLFGGNGNKKNDDKKEDPKEETKTTNTIDLLNNIKDNYSLKITKIEDSEESILYYSIGSGVTTYESKAFKQMGYVSYNNEYYYLKNDVLVKTKTFNFDEIFYSKYYDIEFIKKILASSTETIVSKTVSNYTLKLSSYIKEYNYENSTNLKVLNDKDMIISISHTSKYIDSITIDYSASDKIINNNLSDLIYEIVIKDTDSNDFDFMIGYINDLKK